MNCAGSFALAGPSSGSRRVRNEQDLAGTRALLRVQECVLILVQWIGRLDVRADDTLLHQVRELTVHTLAVILVRVPDPVEDEEGPERDAPVNQIGQR